MDEKPDNEPLLTICDDGSAKPLEVEMRFFEENLTVWLPFHQGKHVLIKGTDLGGFFDSAESAFEHGVSKWGNTSFLLREIAEEEPADPFVTCEDGTALPIRRSTLALVRENRWDHYAPGKAFKSVLYHAVVGVVGTAAGVFQSEIESLFRYRVELGLTQMQVRMAYGVEKGVIHRQTGRFRKRTIKDRMVNLEANLIAKERDEPGNRQGRPFAADEWDVVVVDALNCCQNLPDQATIDRESIWVCSRMREWPDFTTAPSRMAVKYWLAANDPQGAGPIEREFLKLMWNKRMTAGDIQPEDGPEEGPTEEAKSDKALMDKLFKPKGED